MRSVRIVCTAVLGVGIFLAAFSFWNSVLREPLPSPAALGNPLATGGTNAISPAGLEGGFAIPACGAAEPQVGNVVIRRILNDGSPMGGTRSNIDFLVTQSCAFSDPTCDNNPSSFNGVDSVSGHGAHATNLSGYTEEVTSCHYYIGQSCPVAPQNLAGFAAPPSCDANDCNFTLSVDQGYVTEVVYKYTPTATPINGQCGPAANIAWSAAPTSGLCNAGDAPPSASLSGSNWAWQCLGLN